MVVLEILGGGKHARFERVAGMPVSIGRALDNDVIIDDPYVDAHHLMLEWRKEGDAWLVSDLSSTNHTVKDPKSGAASEVKSGDELFLGKTRIRVYSEHHAVAPTLSLRDLEHRLLEFDAVSWVLTLMAVLSGAVCLQMYFESTIDAIKPDMYAKTTLTILGSVVFIGGFWALISRILKGETRFASLLNMTLVQSMAAVVLTLVLNVVYFNLPGTPGREILQNIVSLFLFVAYVYLCLVLTTKLTLIPKISICSLILVGTLGFMAISGYSKEDQFIYYPKYDGALYSPPFLARSGEPEEEFRAGLPALFGRAKEMVSIEK